MAILAADIKSYLASIANPFMGISQPGNVVEIDRRDVRYMPSFDIRSVKPDWSEGNLIAVSMNAGINEYVEGLKVVVGPEPEFAGEIDCSEVAGALIDKVSSVEIAKLSPLQWAQRQLAFDNPWDLLTAGKLIELARTPGGDLAIEFIMQDALVQLQTYGDKLRTDVERMGRMIIRTARADMTTAQEEVIKIAQDPDGFDTIVRIHKKREDGALRPADVYRAWMRPLKLLKSVGCHLWTLIDDIVSAQTLPFGELDAPTWIDAYTGVSEVKEGFVSIQTPEDEEEVEPTLEEQAMAFSESFNSEDGLGIEEDDLWSGDMIGEEPVEGVTFAMQNDYKPSSDFDELRKESYPLVKACRTRIADIQKQAKSYAKLGLYNDEAVCEWRAEWVSGEFRKSSEAVEFLEWMRLKARPEAKNARLIIEAFGKMNAETQAKLDTVGKLVTFLHARYPSLYKKDTIISRALIKDGDVKKSKLLGKYVVPVIDETLQAIMGLNQLAPVQAIIEPLRELTVGAQPQDLLLIFLGLDSDFGFTDEDMTSIRTVGGSYTNLYEFYEEFGDSVLDSMGDGFYRRETTEEMISEFCEQTLVAFADKCPAEGNPVQTKAYVEAFLRSAVGTTSLTTLDKQGKPHNSATTAGWEAWRQSKSPEGNAVYHKALEGGKTHEQAMITFKAITKAEKGDKIVQVMPSGLVLASGRKIDWRIAKMKFERNEMSVGNNAMAKLISILSDANWGGELLSYLLR